MLPEFIAENPGRRPAAWWLFSAPEDVEIDDENGPEMDVLFDHGLFAPEELEAIAAKARELIACNRGQDPKRPGSNFIPDMYGHIAFSIEHELLNDSELPDFY